MSKIIFLNGTSSSGKTTIIQALRLKLPLFCSYAPDQLNDAGFRPLTRSIVERERFFGGFHRSIAAFADAGNDLIVEHIIEEEYWAIDLRKLLSHHDVFWVRVHASKEALEQRERQRGDRPDW